MRLLVKFLSEECSKFLNQSAVSRLNNLEYIKGMKKIFLLLLLYSANSNASLLAASDNQIFMVGCDGKIYSRTNEGQFAKMGGALPEGVKAKDILFRNVKNEQILYIMGDDGKLYYKDAIGDGIKLSGTQQPEDSIKSCSESAATASSHRQQRRAGAK